MHQKALLETGRVSEAKDGYDRLLAIPQTRENGEIYWLLLYDRGRIAEKENNRQQAIEFYRKAVEVIEAQRASINTEASKIGFVGDKQAVYQRLIATPVRRRPVRRGLRVHRAREGARARGHARFQAGLRGAHGQCCTGAYPPCQEHGGRDRGAGAEWKSPTPKAPAASRSRPASSCTSRRQNCHRSSA